MNRSDLMARLRARFPNLRQRDVEEATEVILGGIVQSLVEGKRVEIRNFGSFRVTLIQPRMTRNPRTGETFLRQRTRLPPLQGGQAVAGSGSTARRSCASTGASNHVRCALSNLVISIMVA